MNLGVLALAFLTAPSAPARGPEVAGYREAVDRLREAGLAGERAHEFLGKIASVGPRLTGSPQAAAAVDLTRALMEKLGLERVHTEPVEVGHWVRGTVAEAMVTASASRAALPLAVCALGGSVGTPKKGTTAPVVEVRSLAEAAALGVPQREDRLLQQAHGPARG
jgi:hypothetical protein